MAFLKDILLLDFETTGYDPVKSDPIEIGAVLLDKQSLAEKASYHSLIYSDLKEVMAGTRELWRIDEAQIKSAPKIETVAKEFIDKFGFDVIIGSWVQRLDRGMLDKMLRAAGIDPAKYDYHMLDLWPVGYVYLARSGYSGGIDSDAIFSAFGFPVRGKHDALEDCRIEAEIFRKIYNAK